MKFLKNALIHQFESIPAKVLEDAIVRFSPTGANNIAVCEIVHKHFQYHFPFEVDLISTSLALEVYNGRSFAAALAKTRTKAGPIYLSATILEQNNLNEAIVKGNDVTFTSATAAFTSSTVPQGSFFEGKALSELISPLCEFGKKDVTRPWRNLNWIKQQGDSFTWIACDGVTLTKVGLKMPNCTPLKEPIVFNQEQTQIFAKIINRLDGLAQFFVTTDSRLGFNAGENHFFCLNGLDSSSIIIPDIQVERNNEYYTQLLFHDKEEQIQMKTKVKIVTERWQKEFEEKLRLFRDVNDTTYDDVACSFQTKISQSTGQSFVEITAHYKDRSAALTTISIDVVDVKQPDGPDSVPSVCKVKLNAYNFARLASGFTSEDSLTFFENGVAVAKAHSLLGTTVSFQYGLAE